MGGGCKGTEGEGKRKIQRTFDNSGAGFSLVVTLEMDPKIGAVTD